MNNRLREILQQATALNQALPPAPWEADIDDPGTESEEFTGKFCHPECPHSSTPLYDDARVAVQVATMRNLFHELIQELEHEQ
jgi:hypothetical protein